MTRTAFIGLVILLTLHNSAFSHSYTSVIEALRYHINRGSPPKLLCEEIASHLKSFEGSVEPAIHRTKRALFSKRNRRHSAPGNLASSDEEIRSLITFVMEAKTQAKQRQRYQYVQNALEQSLRKPVTPKRLDTLKRLGKRKNPASKSSKKPVIRLGKQTFAWSEGAQDAFVKRSSFQGDEGPAISTAAAARGRGRIASRRKKVSPRVGFGSIRGNEGRFIDMVADSLDIKSAGAFAQVDKGMYRWAKGGGISKKGTSSPGGGAAVSSEAAAAVMVSDSVTEQRVINILRSQKELDKLFEGKQSVVVSAAEVFKQVSPDSLSLYRARLRERFEALNKYFQAEQEQIAVMKDIDSPSVRLFMRKPLAFDFAPAGASVADVARIQVNIAKNRVTAIDALERVGVIVQEAPKAKAEKVYWDRVIANRGDHSDGLLAANARKSLAEQELNLHMLRVRRAPVAKLAEEEGALAHKVAIAAGDLPLLAGYKRSKARLKVLKENKAPVSDIADAEGEVAQSKALLDDDSYAHANLLQAQTLLRVLKAKRGPALKIAEAEQEVRRARDALIDH